jgi:hypothetical protein
VGASLEAGSGVDTIEITDERVPLGALPKTGDETVKGVRSMLPKALIGFGAILLSAGILWFKKEDKAE